MLERLMVIAVVWTLSFAVFLKMTSIFYRRPKIDNDLDERFFAWVNDVSILWVVCFLPVLMVPAAYFALRRAKPREDEVEEESEPERELEPIFFVERLGESVDPRRNNPSYTEKGAS